MPSEPGGFPECRGATTPEEFLERLRHLKAWSGLSFRDLERRAKSAGDILPYSTIASLLRRSRSGLPREELVASYVRACGGDEEQIAEWLTTRRRIAMNATDQTDVPAPQTDAPALQTDAPAPQADGPAPQPDAPAPPAPSGHRARRRLAFAAAVLAVMVAGTVAWFRMTDGAPPQASRSSRVGPALPPAPGWYKVRAVRDDKCADRGSDHELKPIVVQWDCKPSPEQHFYLEQADRGQYRIRAKVSKGIKKACWSVPVASPEEHIRHTPCDDGDSGQLFALKTEDSRASTNPTFRIVPLRSRTDEFCVRPGPINAEGIADLFQVRCSPSPREQFAFDPL